MIEDKRITQIGSVLVENFNYNDTNLLKITKSFNF